MLISSDFKETVEFLMGMSGISTWKLWLNTMSCKVPMPNIINALLQFSMEQYCSPQKSMPYSGMGFLVTYWKL